MRQPLCEAQRGGKYISALEKFGNAQRGDRKMTIDDCPRKKWASEWDGGWFCYKCERLMHWKTKAYVICGHGYCRMCAEKILGAD